MSKHFTLDGEKLLLEVPDDLDAKLLASGGISAVEMHRQLGGNCIAGTLAKALAPLVPGLAVRPHELASAIARHGSSEVRIELLGIYAKAVGAKPKKKRPASSPAKPDEPEEPPLTVAIYCDRYMAGEGREDPAMLQFAVNNGEEIEAEFERRNEAALEASGEGTVSNGAE